MVATHTHAALFFLSNCFIIPGFCVLKHISPSYHPSLTQSTIAPQQISKNKTKNAYTHTASPTRFTHQFPSAPQRVLLWSNTPNTHSLFLVAANPRGEATAASCNHRTIPMSGRFILAPAEI